MIIVFISSSLNAYSQENINICKNDETVIAFINGVLNSKHDALDSLSNLERKDNSKKITYEILYNYTNGLEDFVEVFDQRLAEHEGLLANRFELFFEALAGGGDHWSRIINVAYQARSVLDGYFQWSEAAVVRWLTQLIANPPTSMVYAEHQARIENWILEGKKLLLLAHSQGNLFANVYYDFALTKTSAASVKVVHVAPATAMTKGDHVLADKDIVINLLRSVGNIPNHTDVISEYLYRPAGINGAKDLLGHGFLEIYLNPSLTTASHVQRLIDQALTELVAPVQQASSGFFTASLTWDGLGDVDMHIFEPNGTHVYYASKTGSSGYLDVDNINGYGPEHYYASCNANQLMPGLYRIDLANYRGADNRLATVQIASSQSGVLGTKQVTLGERTGDIPSVTAFNVLVEKSDSGKFTAKLQ